MYENISLGKGRKAQQVDLAKMQQGGIIREAKNEKNESIFSDDEKKIFDTVDKNGGKANGVLDEEELNKFLEDLKNAAGNGRLSKREANKFLKEHGLKDIDPKTLFSFVDKISQSSENINSCKMDDEGNIIIEYKDDKTETINSENQTSTIQSKDGKITEEYNAARELTKKTVKENETDSTTTEYSGVDKDGNPIPTKETVISEKETEDPSKKEKTTTTTTFEKGKKKEIITSKDNGFSIITTLDENEKPKTEVETQGKYTEIHREYVDGNKNPRETKRFENKGLDTQKEYTYEYSKDGTEVKESISELGGKKSTVTIKKDKVLISQDITEPGKTTKVSQNKKGGYTEEITETIGDGENKKTINTTNELNSKMKRLSQTKQVGTKQYQLTYDGTGNTTGIIVQNGESPAAIAKKFGVPLDKLLEANADKLNGKKYFAVGEEIKIPREMEADEKVLRGRKDAQGAKAEYAQEQARIQAEREARRQQIAAEKEARRQRIAAENKIYHQLGLKNRKGAGTTIKDNKGNKYTVIGQAGFQRTIAKDRKGKIHVIAHDGVDLKTNYVAADVRFVREGKKRIVVKGRAYYTDGAARDRHGRMNVTDWTGREAILSGGKSKTDLSDRVILHNGYVQASDARDAAKDAKQEQGTFSEGNNVTQYKDASGKIWYFDEKTGKALVKGQYSNFVNKEAQAISESIYDAAEGIGTKNEQLERAVNYIQSPEMFEKVNAHIAPKNSDYTPTADTTALEALILDENDHGTAQGYFRTLINNGAMTTSQAGACVARELEHELHGRTFGYTSTEGVNRVMNLCHDRNVRLEVESQLAAKHPELKANEGSITRAYLADDGWNPQEVDQFDANWVANNAYTQATYKKDKNGQIVRDEKGNPIIEDMGDQEHRNGVIERLSFDYEDKEALHKGLKAMNDNPDSQDYICFAQRAVEENQRRHYKQQFTEQECVQQYLAGRATDDGQVDVEQLSACNTLLFKAEKPARVRAEESLYAAKNGDMSHVFDSMDPEVYEAQQKIFAKGDIKGCKSVQDAYNKAMAQARADQKVSIKANAIISKQVPFTQKQITDFTIELMHSIDNSTGAGASSHQSGSNTTDAEYKTEQLKAILTNHPEIINDVKARVQKGDFTFDVTTDAGDMVISNRHDNKQKYLDIINNTNTAAKDAIFYDEKGNKITDPKQIEALTKANMNSLQGLRQYVAELERDFKMGVDEEGAFSDAANGLVEYSGLGTGRGEVANNYRYAKNLLKQLELAAQGKLRDSSGKVISAQELAKKVQNDIGKLSQTNADYKSSISMAKMGMVLAPVIVVTTVATGGMAAAGWGSAATVAGVTTAVVEGSMQATELITSETGNTAENRASATQQVLWDSALAATGTKIGQLSERMVQAGVKMTSAAAERMLIQEGLNANAARVISKSPNAVSTVLKRAEEITAKLQQTKLNQVMTAAGDKFVDAGAGLISKQTALLNKVAPNLNPETARKVSVILARTEAAGFEVTSDSVQSLVQMYCQEGKFDEASFTQGMIMSIAGNTIGHMTSGVGDLRHTTRPQTEPQGVLEHATGNGSHQSGGRLNADKMDLARQQVADVAQHGTPQEVAHVHQEADLQQAQSRPQGRELKHVIEDNAGFVSIGKERIALDSSDLDALSRAKKEVSGWADGTRDKEAILAKIDQRMAEINGGQVHPTTPARGVEVVDNVNDNVNQTAGQILGGKPGAIGSHDAATLRDHLTNNLKSEGEIEQFIADVRKRVGVDEKGNMHVYQVEGQDHAADIVKAAENKLKDIRANKASLQEASDILDRANAAGKGLSEDELKTLKTVAGKMTDPESLQTLIDKMKSNKKIKGHSGAKKAIGEMEAQVQKLKEAEAGHVQRVQTADEPQGASDGAVANFTAEQRKMIAEGKLNPDGTPIEAQPKVESQETPAAKSEKVNEPENNSPNSSERVSQAQIDEARERMIKGEELRQQKADQVSAEIEITPQKVASLKKESAALDKEIKASNEIPAQQKQLWTSVKEKYEVILDSVKSMKDGIKSSAIATYCKDVLQGLKSIAKTAPKAIKQKLTQMAKNIQALMKTSTIQSSPNRGVLGTNPKLDKYVINPNKPAMKISQEAKDIARDCGTTPEHVQFCMDNKELFKGNTTWSCWSGFEPKNQKHGAWKMHMYSVDEKDWQKMSEVLIPYLRDHDIEWKTFNMVNGADHLNGGVQEGKAFTIYPRDNAHMEQVAKDLDYIIRNNNLETSGSNIVGDRAMGDNGRLFYRYEYNTGAVKDDVLDLSPGSKDWSRYKELYDGNSDRVNRHGEGRYLADDMTAADDPWLNFNPADPKSHATYNRNNSQNATPEVEVLEGLYAADNFRVGDKLPKEQGVVMTPNSKLLLADQIELDLSSPQIQSRLKNLKDGETLTIGREGDIVVGANNDLISRKHLTIEKFGDNIIVKDTSTNGTKITSKGHNEDVVMANVDDNVEIIDVATPEEAMAFDIQEALGVNENYANTMVETINKKGELKDKLVQIVQNSKGDAGRATALIDMANGANIDDLVALSKNRSLIVEYGETGIVNNNFETALSTLQQNPQYHNEIITYLSTQRSVPGLDMETRYLNNYVNLLKEYPNQKDLIVKLASNPNLEYRGTELRDLTELIRKNPKIQNDVLTLSSKKLNFEMIQHKMDLMNRYPELRSSILDTPPAYQLIDQAPNRTSAAAMQQRKALENKALQLAPKELNALRTTLGNDFYRYVKWEEIIPTSASQKEIKEILTNLNDESKFFARSSLNERKYGKNIAWAHEINNVSNIGETLIRNGEDFRTVIGNIAEGYRGTDIANTLKGDRSGRRDSGLNRETWSPEGQASTPIQSYKEYKNRLNKLLDVNRTAPYNDIKLTEIRNIDRGVCMIHPANKYVTPGLKHMEDAYNKLQPLFDKVQKGGSLKPNELEFAHKQISEIYYLMANIMPWARGSNGISDITMRSMYKALNVEMPAMKHGVSLDLEAFDQSLGSYQAKWKSFFENGIEVKPNNAQVISHRNPRVSSNNDVEIIEVQSARRGETKLETLNSTLDNIALKAKNSKIKQEITKIKHKLKNQPEKVVIKINNTLNGVIDKVEDYHDLRKIVIDISDVIDGKEDAWANLTEHSLEFAQGKLEGHIYDTLHNQVQYMANLDEHGDNFASGLEEISADIHNLSDEMDNVANHVYNPMEDNYMTPPDDYNNPDLGMNDGFFEF